jgi:hypothetical protein
MHVALRPYVTTGVAIVGASVLVAAPMQPTPPDIQVANPVAQVERSVQLTANEIENAVNQLVFAATKAGVSIAQLTTPLVAQILGIPEQQAAIFLAVGTIGLFGPLISGTGAVGTALQDIVDSDGLEELVLNFIGAPGTIIDGVVNGNYGPNLAPLILGTNLITILAGGLINEGNLPFPIPTLPPYTVPGTIPTLQGLIEQLFGLFSPAAAMSAPAVSAAALAPAPDSTVEDGINALLFQITKVGLNVVELAAPLVAPILGVSEDQAKAFLALGALGFAGPLISGTGAVGTALQNVINSDGLGELVTNLIGAPGTVIDGVVNGGYGPNLQPLLPFLPKAIPVVIPGVGPILVPVTAVFAPGLINNPGYTYNPLLQGLGVQPNGSGFNLITPSTTTTLQGLVQQLFGALPSAGSATPFAASAGTQELKTASTEGGIQTNLVQGGSDSEGSDEGPEVTPKKHRPRVELNVLKFNPLDPRGKKGDSTDVSDSDGKSDSGPAAHRLGDGKVGSISVRDVIKRVTGHDDAPAPKAEATG